MNLQMKQYVNLGNRTYFIRKGDLLYVSTFEKPAAIVLICHAYVEINTKEYVDYVMKSLSLRQMRGRIVIGKV